ncbi:MAG: tRNA (guanosine(46)-N7)-methyltransferase TrmB [Helicobacteraceae bacterium]|jgi:tRNA (guanine-N7-)-methyltransferase|nr:tRNA (guanosine(46)-N7)-methyltransferase TrmB [Helicobacteraceae bacterium]
MPHLIVRCFTPFNTPLKENGAVFTFCSDGDEGICGVEMADKNFLLRWFRHEKGTILKADKTTRPPLLNVVKHALFLLAAAGRSTIISRGMEDARADTHQALFEPNSFLESLPPDQKLWIEIGFGSGRNMLHNAKTYPDTLHLGVELHRPSAEQLLNRAKREKLNNIAVIISDARAFMSALGSASAERIIVHFPIPWDESPKRRVFTDSFVAQSLRVLKKGGILELRTDNESYLQYVQESLKDVKEIKTQSYKNAEAAVSSKYEDRWKRENRDIYELIVTNLGASEAAGVRCDFSFKKPISDKRAIGRLSNVSIVNERFILKTRHIWRLLGGGAFFQLVFGAIESPSAIFLLIRNERAEYYPYNPLQTEQNALSHKELLEVLYA